VGALRLRARAGAVAGAVCVLAGQPRGNALGLRRGGLVASRRSLQAGSGALRRAARRAGAGAGAVGVLAGQPLDVVRVRLQQPRSGQLGALASLRTVVAAEGAGALFRGSFYPLTTIALQARAPAYVALARPRRAVSRSGVWHNDSHSTLHAPLRYRPAHCGTLPTTP